MTLLSTDQMAEFVARGVIRLDAVVPADVNAQALEDFPRMFRGWLEVAKAAIARAPQGELGSEPALVPRSGTPLADAYDSASAFGRMVRVPEVAGAIRSLVGAAPVVDHHFIHLKPPHDETDQGLHADAIIDSGPAFDIQLFWFPHDVPATAGGTRFVPGSHFRRINTDDIARYQHLAGEEYFVGDAGTVLIFHQGLWHAGAANHTDTLRMVGKLRLNPTEPQVKLWDISDLDSRNRADDHVFARHEPGTVAAMLRRNERWFETSTHRLELVQRTKLWRYLSGDDRFDIDWYTTRTEQREALTGPMR